MKLTKLGDQTIDLIEMASQGSAALGTRGAGKTYLATYMAEKIHAAGVPFVAFDPIGMWRFLRVPGKGPGLPVVVAGGAGGDLPLTPESAPEIVRAAMKSSVSLVLDLFSMDMTKADWRRIVRDCMRVLLYENGHYGLRYVFLEEASEFIPQKVTDGLVYAEIEKLARMGGNAQLGYMLINQRAEEVNKAILELCDNLFLMRQKGRNSLINLSKWLDVANVKPPKLIIDTLATLPAGDCWVWLAGAERPERATIPEKNSFHPDRRAMTGHAAPGKRQAVDVGAFVTKLRGALEAAAAKDGAEEAPAAPRKTRAQASAPDSTALADAEARGHMRGYEEGFRAGQSAERQHVEHLRAALRSIHDRVAKMLDSADDEPRPAATPAPPRPQTKTTPPRARSSNSRRGAADKLLGVMDTNPPAKRTWGQFAALAGIKARGGYFVTGRRCLLNEGLVTEENGLVWITSPSASAPAPALDPAANVAQWVPLLKGAAPKILQQLFAVGGEATKASIADAVGLQPTGGYWVTGWAELRNNGIVTLQGDVATLTELFHPGNA